MLKRSGEVEKSVGPDPSEIRRSRLLRNLGLGAPRKCRSVRTRGWRQFETPALPIPEHSIVLFVREDLENKDHGADSRGGLHGVHPAVGKRQLKSPRIRERGGETAPRCELHGNSILRNLIPGKRVFLQTQGPPLELLSLFGPELPFDGPCTRSDPNLACREASQINEPPSPPQSSRTRGRR